MTAIAIKEKTKIYLVWQADEATDQGSWQPFLEEASEKIKDQGIMLESSDENGAIFSVSTDLKDNVHKRLKVLQKQLIKIGDQSDYKEAGILSAIASDKNWLILSLASEIKENSRVSKLLQSVSETFYYDVRHIYGPSIRKLRAYLEHQKVAVIDHADRVYLIDTEALQKKINLNCAACTKEHPFGCCCGSPCNFSKKNLAAYKKVEKEIIQELKQMEPDFYKALLRDKNLEGTPGDLELVDFEGTVSECGGRCALLIRQNGIARCLIHQYALAHEQSVYELSPLSCLLFPLEIIECITEHGKKLYLLTSVVEDEAASLFGRWGSYRHLDISFACTQEKLCNEVFKKEDYHSVYEENKGLLTHEFGKTLYDTIGLALKNE